ncbi:MAG: diaminobutyrate--2-oxoglutarate transaminase family protein [Alphaproteobacteria bacterium]|nr:diaminobutyrate--2-oxoglutarate transaminase family protein [Alphaproteobacteria bacterium]
MMIILAAPTRSGDNVWGNGLPMRAVSFLDRQIQTESNARTYPRRLPIVIDKAEGLWVTDVNDKVYMDCLAGAGTLVLGHNHPVVIDALRWHLDEGRPMIALDLPTPTKDAFVEALLSTLPCPLRDGKIHFCSPSGSDAVEAAVKLVKIATGRRGILAFSGGYHGHTHGSLAMMGNRGPKRAISGLMPDVQFMPFPYCYRCPFGRATACGDDRSDPPCQHLLRAMVHDPNSGLPPLAGALVEVVQGEGGVIPSNPAWMRAMADTLKNEAALIVDEVQTGWGRTGKLYAFEHSGVCPDVVVLAKAIGGGLPLAVIIYRRELDCWESGAHAGTFRASQMAMAAGLATLKHIQDAGLAENAEVMGRRLCSRLKELQTKHPFIGDVRGVGLMLGMEIVAPEADATGRPATDGARARRLQTALLAQGVIAELGGRDDAVLRLLPPLNITLRETDLIADAITAACGNVAA